MFATVRYLQIITCPFDEIIMTVPSYVCDRSEERRVLNWQKDVAKSTRRQTSLERANTTRIVVNHVTTPTVVVSRAAPRPKKETEINAQAIVGTILGAGAGAAVAYAMVKGEQDDRRAQESRRVDYPVKKIKGTTLVVRAPLVDVGNYQSQYISPYDNDRSQSHHRTPRPRVETLTSSAHSGQKTSTTMLRSVPHWGEIHPGHTIVQTKNGTKVLSGAAKIQSPESRLPSQSKSEMSALSAVDLSLPQGRHSTQSNQNDTIVPNDSISQVSTNRPRDKERLSYKQHSGSSKSGSNHRRCGVYSHSSAYRPDRSRANYSRR